MVPNAPFNTPNGAKMCPLRVPKGVQNWCEISMVPQGAPRDHLGGVPRWTPPWGSQIGTKSSLWSLSAGACCTKGPLGSKKRLLFGKKNIKLKIVKIHRDFSFQIDIGKVRSWPCWAFWVPRGRPEGPRKDFKSHTSGPKKLFRKMSYFSQKVGPPPIANRHSF